MAPGFRFAPTDLELVHYYLSRKVAGVETAFCIPEATLYGEDAIEPQRLFFPTQHHQAQDFIHSIDCELYFYTTLSKKHPGGRKISRAAGNSCGYWKAEKGQKEIYRYPLDPDRKQLVGFRRPLSFCDSQHRATGWGMDEYTLAPNSGQPNTDVEWTLCRIKRGRPTTGAASSSPPPLPGSSNKRARDSTAAAAGSSKSKKPRAAVIEPPPPEVMSPPSEDVAPPAAADGTIPDFADFDEDYDLQEFLVSLENTLEVVDDVSLG